MLIVFRWPLRPQELFLGFYKVKSCSHPNNLPVSLYLACLLLYLIAAELIEMNENINMLFFIRLIKTFNTVFAQPGTNEEPKIRL